MSNQDALNELILKYLGGILKRRRISIDSGTISANGREFFKILLF